MNSAHCFHKSVTPHHYKHIIPTSVMVAASCCVEASLQQLVKVEGKLNAAKLLRNPEGNPLQSESHTFSTQ